jgi:hypothetical protein
MSNQTGNATAVGSKSLFGRLLCMIGVHKWGAIGYDSILNPIALEQCRRCKIGRQFHPAGMEFTFTAEQMRTLDDGDSIAMIPDVTKRPSIESSATGGEKVVK